MVKFLSIKNQTVLYFQDYEAPYLQDMSHSNVTNMCSWYHGLYYFIIYEDFYHIAVSLLLGVLDFTPMLITLSCEASTSYHS